MTPKPRTIEDYSSVVTSASMSVLLEVMTLLAAYRDSLVLVGGWVPYFLLRDHGGAGYGDHFEHAGSIDIDLLVDPTLTDTARYATMLQLLLERGYAADSAIRYRFNRSWPGLPVPIGVDFLTPEPPPGQGKKHRHRKVQTDLAARVVPFGEMGFRHWSELHLEGELPTQGGRTKLDIRMTDLPSFFAFKGIALGERYKEKDAYDLYAITRYYGEGVEEIIKKLEPHVGEAGLKKGLTNIQEKFRDRDAEGPSWVVNFISPTSEEEAQRLRTDAFFTMAALAKLLR